METQLDTKQLIHFYKEMLLSRRLEERIGQLYVQGNFGGFCHLYIGQESVTTGCLNTLRKGEDYVLTAYRDHIHPLVLGMQPKDIIAELLGKYTGCSKGKGGSMHMFSHTLRFAGGNGIVGAHIPVAAGIGWKIKATGEDLVCMCFLGDGAINQGQFHETLNMACLWKLPCIFIIENNFYAMGTHIKRACTLDHLSDRARAYNMKQERIDGRDVIHTYTSMKQIVDYIRTTQEPFLVEIETYRFKGHSMSDPAQYRQKNEVTEERAKDCLFTLGSVLQENNIADTHLLDQWDTEIDAIVEEAVTHATNDPEPPIEEMWTDVYVGEKILCNT